MGITDKSIIAVLTVLAILCSASAQQTVTINEPDNGAVFQDVLSALINFTVTDDDNETLECILVVNGEDNISNTSTQNATFTVLPLLTGIYGNYTYYVKCTDYITWNASDSRWLLFNETVDMTPPVISSVENVSITNQSARITWNTDDVSNATLYWGEYPSLGNLSVNASPGTLHSISLSGLRNNTVYQYIASSCNSDGYCSNSSLHNFTTLQSVDMTPPVISSVENVSITNQSARITWNTDDVSNATLYWGEYPSLGNLSVNASPGTLHSISLSGLRNNTVYQYIASSCNSDGYCSNSSLHNFTTLQSVDMTPPVISSVQNVSITNQSARITWNTDDVSNATLYWGEYPSLGNLSVNASPGTLHSISLSGLRNNTVYQYIASSCNSDGYCSNSSLRNFTTLQSVDMTPPVISSVQNVSITNQSVRITWNTDDVSNATLYWGEYPSLGNLSVNASPGTLHSISLSGLRNNTVYQYIASSCNSDGYCSNSSLRNFTTLQSVDMTPPVISSVENVSITNQSVRITWNTDDVSNATLYWGPTSGLGNVTVNVTLGTFHSISLFGLASNTTYYYNVSSCNTDGYCANSSQRSFTTFLPSTPIIYNVQLSSYYTANNTNVTINVTVSSTVTRVEAEGVNLSNVSATLWTGTITLIAGRSPVNVIAYNAYNDSVSDNSVSFTVDTTPPVISSVAISSNYARNNTNVTVTVNASGAVSVTAEGVALSANGVIWTGTIPLVSGASPVNIVAIDNVSNQATNNALTFTIDDTAPVIQNATLSDYYVKSGDTISVIVFVFDPPQNSTATVTANGVALINTSNIRWIGNITAGANGGNLSIIATDTAGNSITDLSKAAFTVDNVAPNLTIIVPAAGGAYSVENIIFNISVAEANLSRFNVSLDNLSFYGSALNGTHLPNYTGLKTGLHTAVFSAEDRAGNSVSETRQFTVTVPLNVSQALSLLNDSIEANVTDIVLKASGVDISTNTSVDMNISVELEIKVNAAGTNITVKVPEFNGLDASWKQNFTIKTNLTASESRLANSTAGTKIESIVLLQNMSRFLSGENYEMAVVTFYVHLLGRDVLYIADDFGSKIYKLRECGSVPSSVNSVTDACYMNFTGNVTLYLPHFSGGAIANDTVAPNITVSVPVNNTLYPNSNMTLGFSVYEANPANGTFCNYTLFNGTEVITQDLDITAAEMINDGSTEYSFSVALPALLNGTYWLNISCMDANNRSTSVHRNFSISDSTVPVILSFGPTGVQSTAGTSVSVTLSVVTDESAICRYSATNVSFDNMSLILGSGSYAKSHETAISYSADDASEVWYVACRDVNGLNSLIEMISYSVDVGSGGGSSRGSSGSSAGGGGIIPTIDAITLVKSWLKLEAGEKASAALQGMAFTGLNFTAAEALTGAQFILKQTESVPADSTPLNLKVYRYLNIRELNVRENQILLPSLDFKVPKKWLMQNSLSPESIALYRFTDGWKIQPTALVFEDIEYAHYSAGPLDGFSLFAIAEKPMPIVSQTPAEQPVERTNPPGAEPEEDVIPFDDTREKPVIKLQKKKSLAWLFVFIAVVLGIAASVIYYISRKNPY